MISSADLMKQKLDLIVELMDALIAASTIKYDPNAMQRLAAQGILAVIPDSAWGPLDGTQRGLQRKLLELWDPWVEQLRLLFSVDTKLRQTSVDTATQAARKWIERDERDFTIPKTLGEAPAVFRKHVAPLYEALQSLSVADSDLVVVPDTNVLLRTPDVVAYADVLGVDEYTVVLVPSVLAELDAHKINHRNESVREKARKITSRIKGWRNQGDLSRGVKVQGAVYVRVEGREPDFGATLSWLDSDVVDDRIIASILELQRRRPADRVVLLTGDTVMLAKADAASIPTADTPDPDP